MLEEELNNLYKQGYVSVWYQKVDDGYNIGVDDLIYTKIRNNEVIWRSLYWNISSLLEM